MCFDGLFGCAICKEEADAAQLAALPKSVLSEGAQALVEMLLDPEQYGYAVTPEVRDHARRVLGIPPVEMPPQPVHLTEATFICEAPAGAQMIAVGLKILVVAPGMAPCWLTPTGLVQIDMTQACSSPPPR